jgi:hypothetical protein
MFRSTWQPQERGHADEEGQGAVGHQGHVARGRTAERREQGVTGRRPASWAANTTTPPSSGYQQGLVAHSRLDWPGG